MTHSYYAVFKATDRKSKKQITCEVRSIYAHFPPLSKDGRAVPAYNVLLNVCALPTKSGRTLVVHEEHYIVASLSEALDIMNERYDNVVMTQDFDPESEDD